LKSIARLLIIVVSGLLVGCATILPPAELISARQACAHASATPASKHAPTELRKAQETLALAEKAFRKNPQSSQARHIAIVAAREAKLAEVLGANASKTSGATSASNGMPTTVPEIANDRK